MIEATLAGALAGYAIAIPVGAIAVLIIHIGLTRGLSAGLAAGAGAATADGVYAAVASLAGLGVSSLIGPLVGPIRLIGGLALIVIGLRGLLALRSPRDLDVAQPVAGSPVPRAHGRTYFELLALTLLNPATVIYFAALTVGLPFLGGVPERLAFTGAVFTASLSWQWGLAAFGAALGRGAGHRLHRPTAILGNAMVVGLGVLVLVEAFG